MSQPPKPTSGDTEHYKRVHDHMADKEARNSSAMLLAFGAGIALSLASALGLVATYFLKHH